MLFEYLSGSKALREAKVAPRGGVVDNTLFSHVYKTVGFPARAWREIALVFGLPIMARAAAATVECYLGSAPSLPKLRKKK